ncbi:MAG: HesA/MoeB/ThiF family protein [Gammaproteobacteria bacterium]|nr:HesA/MoeB/ThiF family protein [Gammaproteobacteria bacterium]NND55217.1 HesA/MoeB/ThiF family protein [Gammaproteobacteria bacterium]
MPGSNDIRYARQISLSQIGDAGQARLAAARVLIVGAGGLGNPAGLYLASAGVGHLSISDFDRVDASNLPRQILFRETDVGFPKAEIMARRLIELNPNLTAVGISRRLDEQAITDEARLADLVLDCSDNFQTRWLINRVCHATTTPLVSGAAIRFEGQAAVFPFDEHRSPCYRCLYAEDDENLLDCAGQGILAPVAGMVGALMATEAIKVLIGMPTELAGRLWVYDGLAGSSRTLGISRRDDCPVCG